jgi:hypothetical protein
MSNDVLYCDELDSDRVYAAIDGLGVGDSLNINVPGRDRRAQRFMAGMQSDFGENMGFYLVSLNGRNDINAERLAA